MSSATKKPKGTVRKTTNNGRGAVDGRPSREELLLQGRQLRTECPRSSHAEWKPAKHRIDPLVLMKRSENGRISELLPIRHGRMLKSPFTFYRGAALNMAADLVRPHP
jgi:hypothetical protein